MDGRTVTEKVIDFIETHLDEELTLERLAKETSYSKFYLARAFKEDTGGTVYKYIQCRRLDRAAKQLAGTDIPIAGIAYEAGYGSQQAFTEAFRKEYHLTPKIYRERGFSNRHQEITGSMCVCEGRLAA